MQGRVVMGRPIVERQNAQRNGNRLGAVIETWKSERKGPAEKEQRKGKGWQRRRRQGFRLLFCAIRVKTGGNLSRCQVKNEGMSRARDGGGPKQASTLDQNEPQPHCRLGLFRTVGDVANTLLSRSRPHEPHSSDVGLRDSAFKFLRPYSGRV